MKAMQYQMIAEPQSSPYKGLKPFLFLAQISKYAQNIIGSSALGLIPVACTNNSVLMLEGLTKCKATIVELMIAIKSKHAGLKFVLKDCLPKKMIWNFYNISLRITFIL